jgi:hypothetical protein
MENDIDAAADFNLHDEIVKFHVSVSNHLKALRARKAQLYAELGLRFEDPASPVSPEPVQEVARDAMALSAREESPIEPDSQS